MSDGTYSGEDVVKVMVNNGPFERVRTTGDHVVLRWELPGDRGSAPRSVSVPLHDELSEATLREIAETAGMKDVQRFKDWVDRNT